MMSDNPLVRVTVFGLQGQDVCLISGCGTEIGSAQAADRLARELTALLGNWVMVRYFDLAQPEWAEKFAAILEGARERNLPFPLVAINGDIVLAGPFDTGAVLRMVHAALVK